MNSNTALSLYDSMKIDVARANRSLENVSDLKIPLPPLPEQQKIVSEIEKIESKIATLEKKFQKFPNRKKPC